MYPLEPDISNLATCGWPQDLEAEAKAKARRAGLVHVASRSTSPPVCQPIDRYFPLAHPLRIPASSTFHNIGSTFEITYGSGNAEGVLGSDLVQFAGFQVNQTFG